MKKITLKKLGFIALLSILQMALFLSSSDARSFSTLKSGNWSDVTIWNGLSLPTLQDSVRISAGHNIYIDVANASALSLFIESNATLNGGNSILSINGNLVNGGNLFFATSTLSFSGKSSITAGSHYINNITINPNSSLVSLTQLLTISGNWTNNGTFIPNQNTVLFNGKVQQLIAGTSNIHNFYNLILNMPTGLTVKTAAYQTIVVANSLNVNSNVLIIDSTAELQITSTNPGALIFKPGYGIQGKIKRSVNASGNYVFPLITGNTLSEYCTVNLNNMTGITSLVANFNRYNSGSSPALKIFCVPVTDQLNSGYWNISSDYPPYSGTFDLTLAKQGQSNTSLLSNTYTIIKRGTINTTPSPWVLEGAHNNSTQKDSAGTVIAKRTSLTGFGDFNIGKSSAAIPDQGVTANISKIDAICNNSGKGSATAIALGGTPPYSYNWSTKPVQTTAIATNLAAGMDTVTVKDAFGCIYKAIATINYKSPAPATFYATPGSGNTLNLDVSYVANNTAYYWDFGDNTSASGIKTSHTYSAPGGYQITLRVMDSTFVNCQSTNTVFATAGSGGCILAAGFSYTQDTVAKTISFNNYTNGKNLKWYWDFGNGSYASVQNPSSISYPATGGLHTICLTVEDTVSKCLNTSCQDIQVFNKIDCQTSFLYFSNATSNKVQFDGQSLNTAKSYSWSFDNGDISSLANPTYTYAIPGIYNVCLTTLDSIHPGCQSTYCTSVHAGSGDCKALFTFLPDATSLNVQFKDSSPGTPLAWHWDFGDGQISYLQNPNYKFQKPGFYNVCLTDSNAQGCQNTFCTTVHVGNTDCEALFSSFTATASLSADFKDLSLGSPTAWFWDFGDGNNATTQNPQHTYNNTGLYSACLNTLNAKGCISQSCQDITIGLVGTDCLSDFDYFEKNGTVSFNNKSIGSADTWNWDFGDDSPLSNAKNPTHTYSANGYYRITLTMYDSKGLCFNTAYKDVTIGSLAANTDCLSNFGYFADSTSKQVLFQDKSFGNPISWLWNFGDSTATSSIQNPNHTYKNSGFYEVCLTIKNSNGKSSNYCTVVNIGKSGLAANFAFKQNGSYFYKSLWVFLWKTIEVVMGFWRQCI
jgi:PKD repeat protein